MIEEAARNLFDNRLGWSDNRNPYAPRELWHKLGVALYGENDDRVIELAHNNRIQTDTEKQCVCSTTENMDYAKHCPVHGYVKWSPTPTQR